ncbi:unnamed protein product [Onchocerca flexuosa]|uniref:Integrase_H2C2 domain-containing protein n=1 Tax=Onchocerca flexuosa TaxID=387005 RepID=A0A183HS05_9BILA|nr:unnamed protein product [Onchocerca flexuosa]
MVSTKFYWNSITSDVEQFIKQCPRCRITRMRYIASNNVPWRKGGRYGDIYTGNWDGNEDDYALSDRSSNRTWKFARSLNGGEYAAYSADNEINILPSSWKHDRPANDVMIADEMANEEIDIENDTNELGKKIPRYSVINLQKYIRFYLSQLTVQLVKCDTHSMKVIFVFEIEIIFLTDLIALL